MLQPIWAALKNAINQVIADSPRHLAHEVADHIADHINERRAEAKEHAEPVKPATGLPEAVRNPQRRTPRSK